MNFSFLSLQNIAFPPYSRLGPKVLTATLWKDFLCPRRIWNISSHHSTEGWAVQCLGSLFFFSFASSFRIYMKNKEKNVPVSRSWKLKVKLLAITGNMFTLAFWLTGCLWILYKIKPVFVEEFVIENPVHDTLHTSISEVWKNPQNPYFQPRTKAVEDYSWLCNWKFRFHHCLFYFSFGFSWNKTFFSGQKKVSVSGFSFQGIPFQIFKP